MNQLTRFDTAALNRALIGFDTLFDAFEKKFASQNQSNYPPYNVVKFSENDYAIEIAVAGFRKDDISIELANEQLTISGTRNREDEEVTYLHRGLGGRDFVRIFPLAEHIIVKGAVIENGILRIDLERIVPEALKPRMIDITEKK